ncbi:MAG: glycoside hydrolase family 3 protein [Spirochaetaceae bacterium]|jgi:beta-N-acetylhexosaminidase|nr:glycoside hydrolase family 3 protein [Spirochaetaceae bacterium]
MLKIFTLILVLSVSMMFFAACVKGGAIEPAEQTERITQEKEERDRNIRRNFEQAAGLVKLLTDEQLAAQVIMTGIDACGPLSAGERERLRRVPVGAVMLFRKNLNADNQTISGMIDELNVLGPEPRGADDKAPARIKPFIAVDHEGGDVHRFTGAVERLPPPLSYWELDDKDEALLAIERDAEKSGKELAALGITMNLAPLAETLTSENSAFLGSRSYGPDIEFTAKAAAAFIRGMKAANIACVLKHFPGNAGADPHIETPVLQGGGLELRAAVSPFASVIDALAPSAVMVSHVVVPAWDASRNASLSEIVMREKLRGELDFQGLILADDFSMGAVSGGYGTEEKTIMALRAGADMVMAWPRNLVSIHQAILAALDKGGVSRERLEDAAARVVSEKLRMENYAEGF